MVLKRGEQCFEKKGNIGGSRIFGWVEHMNINEGWGMVSYKRSTHTVTCIPSHTVTCTELFHGHMTRGL